MLRRIGYALGLMFVLACVAAYPLTWGRAAAAHYRRATWMHATVATGQITVGAQRMEPRYFGDGGFVEVSGHVVHRDQFYRVGWFRIGGGYNAVYFPLWMPALAASLFMAWRWRRGRRRRGAGFPVADRQR